MPTKKSELSYLENESKRLNNAGSSLKNRASEYQPTLEELSSISFENYIRCKILKIQIDDFCSTQDIFHHSGLPENNFAEKSKRDDHAVTTPGPPTTRSNTRKRPISLRNISSRCGRRSSQSFDNNTSSTTTTTTTNPQSLSLNEPKIAMSEGIAKIKLPCGWWDQKGIENDTTARGAQWQAGTRLGEMMITNPIKQCPCGIGGIYDFTLIELPPLSVANFRVNADQYRYQQIGKVVDTDFSDEQMDNLARKFWRRLRPTMEPAVYGADMVGSLFGGDYASGWNIDRLDTCIQLLKVDSIDEDTHSMHAIPGVTNAYLYFGMWSTVFAAHTEDMNLLSINYLHAGAPKYWYAILPEDTQRFESLVTSRFVDVAKKCPSFLRHKQYLLSPRVLDKAGIRFTTIIQRPGDAVITFPGAYHFGFNTGFNVAESTNFAIPEWVPIGLTAKICMCQPHSVRIDMARFQELLYQFRECSRQISCYSYIKWAEEICQKERENEKRVKISGGLERKCSPLSKKSRKGVVVEIFHMVRKQSATELKDQSGTRKSCKRKLPFTVKGRSAAISNEQWRLALQVKAVTFVRNTNVLCKLSCVMNDGEDNQDQTEQYFCGKIAEVFDDHVRIHFPGMSKSEDVWMPSDSPTLFLDGGPKEPPDFRLNKTI